MYRELLILDHLSARAQRATTISGILCRPADFCTPKLTQIEVLHIGNKLLTLLSGASTIQEITRRPPAAVAPIVIEAGALGHFGANERPLRHRAITRC